MNSPEEKWRGGGERKINGIAKKSEQELEEEEEEGEWYSKSE